jgi:hypothetical protein
MFRSLIAISAVGSLVLGTPSVRAADDQPKDVILKAIKAHGGEEVLSKLKAATLKGKGKLTLPGVGEVEFTQESAHMLPDKLKESVQLTVMGMNIQVLAVMNGDSFVHELNGKPLKLDDETKDVIRDVGEVVKLVRLVTLTDEKTYQSSLIGEDKIDDKPVIGIRITSKNKKDYNLYFDKMTHLLVKIEHRTKDPNTKKEITEERFLQDYTKNKEGLPVPKKILVKHDGEKFMEIEVSEVEYLEKLDESEFKK